MITQGSRVVFDGYASAGLEPGDAGDVLQVSGSIIHVTWRTGSRAGQVLRVDGLDLTGADSTPLVATAYVEPDDDDLLSYTGTLDQTVEGHLDDSLDVGLMPVHAVARSVYEDYGPEAVVDAMAATGALDVFPEIALDVLHGVEHRIGRRPEYRQVAANLGPDQAKAVLRVAALCLIRDAFGGTHG
jgi:hypothetical protein